MEAKESGKKKEKSVCEHLQQFQTIDAQIFFGC